MRGVRRLALSAFRHAFCDVIGPIPAKYLRFIGLETACDNLDLFSAALLRGLAEFRRNLIRINQLLGERRFGEREGRDTRYPPKR